MKIATGPEAGFATDPAPEFDAYVAREPADGFDAELDAGLDADAALIGFEESLGAVPRSPAAAASVARPGRGPPGPPRRPVAPEYTAPYEVPAWPPPCWREPAWSA